MAKIEVRLKALGLPLPPPTQAPPGVTLPLRFLPVVGQRVLGRLDRIGAGARAFGMLDSANGFKRQRRVLNRLSDPMLELFKPGMGAHCRSAVGMAKLPFDTPMRIEREVELRS